MKGLTIYSSKFEGLLSKQTLCQILLKEAPRRWRSHKVQMFIVDRQSNSETEKQIEAKTLTEKINEDFILDKLNYILFCIFELLSYH